MCLTRPDISGCYEEKIKWLREVMKWQKEVSKDDTDQENAYKSLFEDRVYVFTPNGDVLDMSAGATPLDFAYHIHTEIGHHCRGAKINGVMVPLIILCSKGECGKCGKSLNTTRPMLPTYSGRCHCRLHHKRTRHFYSPSRVL